jgi:hypothetical protein
MVGRPLTAGSIAAGSKPLRLAVISGSLGVRIAIETLQKIEFIGTTLRKTLN